MRNQSCCSSRSPSHIAILASPESMTRGDFKPAGVPIEIWFVWHARTTQVAPPLRCYSRWSRQIETALAGRVALASLPTAGVWEGRVIGVRYWHCPERQSIGGCVDRYRHCAAAVWLTNQVADAMRGHYDPGNPCWQFTGLNPFKREDE